MDDLGRGADAWGRSKGMFQDSDPLQWSAGPVWWEQESSGCAPMSGGWVWGGGGWEEAGGIGGRPRLPF